MDSQVAEKNGGFFSFIENVGNKIPHPVYLFICLWILALAASWIMSSLGISVINPSNGKTVTVVNMMTSQKWAEFLRNMGKTCC